MTSKLFNEFNAVSSKQWKQKIQFDLNGADYNDMLVWKSNEDISVKPFYHADDIAKHYQITNIKTWNICQSIYVNHVKKSNQKAIDIIEKGVESIKFIIPSDTISIKDLIKNINFNHIVIHFELLFISKSFINELTSTLKKGEVFIQIDSISHLVKTGNWFSNLKEDFANFETITKHTNHFCINASTYQNAGANIIQQLAYTLAHTNEYLNYLGDKNAINKSIKPIFDIAIGSNYFFEIAKIRALRLLWKTLANEYNINADCHILTTPTNRNKTLYEYNTNMLRTTTECMSAIIGGSNSICNLPYDYIYHKSNEFGERIARNQLLILKHESYFDKVNNASNGSYYIETLTNQLAEKSLTLFKDIEKNGGFLKQLKTGTIQRKIKESALKEQIQFDNNEIILLGSNKYPNSNDNIKENLELYPFVKTNKRKTLIEPIIEKRLAEKLEQKRLKTE